jgi:hypothetical protein
MGKTVQVREDKEDTSRQSNSQSLLLRIMRSIVHHTLWKGELTNLMNMCR